MRIEQINLTYDGREDRLVLRLRMQGGSMAEAWLSRRLTKGLLPAMVRMVEGAIAAADPSVRQELLAYRHQEEVRGGEFNKPFDEEGQSLFGGGPVLIAEVKFHTLSGNQGWRLEFNSGEGRSMQLNLNPRSLHGVIKLFNDILPQTGWDLEPAQLAGATASTGQVMH